VTHNAPQWCVPPAVGFQALPGAPSGGLPSAWVHRHGAWLCGRATGSARFMLFLTDG